MQNRTLQYFFFLYGENTSQATNRENRIEQYFVDENSQVTSRESNNTVLSKILQKLPHQHLAGSVILLATGVYIQYFN